MSAENDFKKRVHILAWSCLLFGFLHLVVAPFAFAGKHPLFPIHEALPRWEVANNEFILGVLFTWAAVLLYLCTQSWQARNLLTAAIVAGTAIFMGVDAIYLGFRPMPGGEGWWLLSKVLAAFMTFNTFVALAALGALRRDPAPHGAESALRGWRKIPLESAKAKPVRSESPSPPAP